MTPEQKQLIEVVFNRNKKYPPNSTAKVYVDDDGNEYTLRQFIKEHPIKTCNVIVNLEIEALQLATQLEKALAENEELKDIIKTCSNQIDSYTDNPDNCINSVQYFRNVNSYLKEATQ